MNVLPRKTGFSLAKILKLSDLEKILSYPTWNYVQEAISATRSYEEGLEAGVCMFDLLEDHREELTQFAYNDHAKKILWFCLEMMDKLDQWEEYLETWHSLRENTDFHMHFVERPIWKHTPPLEIKLRKERAPYHLDPPIELEPGPVEVSSSPNQVAEYSATPSYSGERSVRVHFLWLTHRRKEMIEKKVNKARAGGKVGNLYHRTRDELPPAEIERRVESIMRMAKDGGLMRNYR